MALSRSSGSRDKSVLILTESPGLEHLTIGGCKLPTFKQVLLCFLANRDRFLQETPGQNKDVRRKTAKVVAQEVMGHYLRASIPCISKLNACNKVEDLFKRYLKCCKLQTTCLHKTHGIIKLQEQNNAILAKKRF